MFSKKQTFLKALILYFIEKHSDWLKSEVKILSKNHYIITLTTKKNVLTIAFKQGLERTFVQIFNLVYQLLCKY
jgi:hypothetical protein